MLFSNWRLPTLSSFSLVFAAAILALVGNCCSQEFNLLQAPEEENNQALAKLVKDGKTDEASSMLAQEFRGLALQHLDLGSTRDLTYELRSLSKKIKHHKLMEPMLKELHPGDSTTVEAIGTYAYALELSGQREESITQYRAVLEANSKEDGVRLQLFLSESIDDTSTFGKHFEKVQPRNRQQFTSQILRSLQGPRVMGIKVIGISEAMVQWAETAGPKEDLSWLEPLLDLCSGQLPYRIDTITYLGVPQYRTYRSGLVYENVERLDKKLRSFPDPEKKKSLETQQRVVHDRIAKKMIKVPQLASAGFSALAASRMAVGKDDIETLVEQAKEAIFNSGKHGPIGIVGDNKANKLTPAEFLARHYGLDDRQAKRSEIIQGIVSRLKKDGLDKQALNLQGMYSLYQVPEESYYQHASVYLANVKEHLPYSPELHAFAMSNIVACCVERDLNVDLSALFAKEVMGIAPEKSSFFVQQANVATGKFLGHLAKKNSMMLLEVSLIELRDAYLGDAKKQRSQWALLKNQDALREDDAQLWPLRQYCKMFDEAMGSPEFFFFGLVEADKVQGLEGYNDLLYRRFADHLNRFEPNEAHALADWLKSGRLLDDLAQFDLSQVDQQGTPLISSFLLAFSNEIRLDTRPYLHREINRKKKRSFGVSLINNLLLGRIATGHSNGRDLRYINAFNALGEHLEELQSLPPERQLEILTFVDGLQKQFNDIGGLNQPFSLEGKTAKGLLGEFRKGDLRKSNAGTIKTLLAAKKIEDTGLSEDEFCSWAFEFVQTCDHTDTDRFVAIISKISELVQQVTDRQKVFGGESSPIIANVGLHAVDLQSLKILLAIYEEDRLEDFSVVPMLGGRLSAYLQQIFESGYSADEEQRRNQLYPYQKQADVQLALEHFQDKLGGHLGDRDMRQLAPHFISLYASLPGYIRSHIAKCFENEPKANLKYPKIDHAMRVSWKLGEFFWLDSDPRGNLTFHKRATPPNSVEEVLPHQKELMALVQDESMPIHARLPLVNAMLEWDMHLPPDCIFPACEILLQAAQNKSCISSKQIDNALEIMLRHRDDPRFVTVAGNLAKFWAQDFAARESTGYERGYARRYFPLINATRTIAIAGDGEELLAPLAKKFWTSEHWQVLIESGFVELAETSYRNSCQDGYQKLAYQFEKLKNQPRFFTKAIEKNLPDFLKRFDDPGQRIVAEAFFATQGEQEHPAQFCLHTHEDRKQRVLDLCRRFKTTKFSAGREKEIAAALLCRTPEGLIELASEIPTLAKPHSAETKDVFGALLFIANLAIQAHQGDLDSVFQAQDKLNSEPKPSRRFKNVFYAGDRSGEFRQLRRMLQNAMVLKKRSPGEYEKMLSRLLEDTSPATTVCLCREMSVLAHVAAGKEAQLLKVWGSRKPVRGAYLDMDDLIAIAAKYADQQKMTPKQREDFVSKIWETGSKLKGLVGNGTFRAGTQEASSDRNWRFGLDLLEYTGLLNAQQIQQLGPKLAETNSVAGELWSQLGRRYFQQEKYQKANIMFLKAMESTRRPSGLRRIWYVESLLKLGQKEKAKKVLQERMPEMELDQRRHWAELKTRVGL